MDSQGTRLWEKAKKIIPGGNQLLSKRSEMFLPGLWPSYYAKAKGCEVWDLDAVHYYDFAQMGVGSCVIGYADDDIDRAVIQAIENGSMCSLNSPEEVELAEKLISIHPWAEMCRLPGLAAKLAQLPFVSLVRQPAGTKLLSVAIMAGMIGIWQRIWEMRRIWTDNFFQDWIHLACLENLREPHCRLITIS